MLPVTQGIHPSSPSRRSTPSTLRQTNCTEYYHQTTKAATTGAGTGADAGLLAQLSKQLGGLWAPAVAYRPYGAPVQGGNEPNTAMMHMICPQLDNRNALPYPARFTFTAFSWKWQRSKMVTVQTHTEAALKQAAVNWKPVEREIVAYWGARTRTNGTHVYKELVTDEDVHNLFGRHKEEYLIHIQCEMAPPESDTEGSHSPDQSALPATSKKRTKGGRAPPTKKKSNRTKARRRRWTKARGKQWTKVQERKAKGRWGARVHLLDQLQRLAPRLDLLVTIRDLPGAPPRGGRPKEPSTGWLSWGYGMGDRVMWRSGTLVLRRRRKRSRRRMGGHPSQCPQCLRDMGDRAMWRSGILLRRRARIQMYRSSILRIPKRMVWSSVRLVFGWDFFSVIGFFVYRISVLRVFL